MHEFFAEPRSWVAVAFVLFFAIFGAKLWKALTGMLDGHAAAIRAELEEASRLRTEAEAMLKDAQARREAALTDARSMLEAARAEAGRVAEQAHVDAAAAGRRREQMAMERISAAEKAAVTEVRLAAADIATRAAQDVIAATLSAEGDVALIDRAIATLPAALGRRAA